MSKRAYHSTIVDLGDKIIQVIRGAKVLIERVNVLAPVSMIGLTIGGRLIDISNDG
jgi:hypothetical protein